MRQEGIPSRVSLPSVVPNRPEKLRLLDLFSGIGGLSLGLERTGGFETVAFVEINSHARSVLKEHWPHVRQYEDVQKVTVARLANDGIRPNFIAAGFPCQDISVANTDAPLGLAGERSGLFYEVVRLISELRPDGVLLENVAALLGRGLGDVLGALASLGYDAEWHCIPAARLGAPHRRDRIWIVAHPSGEGWQGLEPHHSVLGRALQTFAEHGDPFAGARRALAGDFSGLRAGDGLSVTMERRRLHHCGNSVVPQIPEIIGRAILEALQSERAAA